jgi:hypothetical protein
MVHLIGGSSNNRSRRQPKKLISYITSTLDLVIVKVLACIYVVFAALGNFFVVRSANNEPGSDQKIQLVESSSLQQLITPALKEPIWQRLRNLEAVVTEMANKPRTIPPEKEDILQESLSRIKGIEFDLQKTRKVVPVSCDKIDPFEGHIV